MMKPLICAESGRKIDAVKDGASLSVSQILPYKAGSQDPQTQFSLTETFFVVVCGPDPGHSPQIGFH